MHLTSFSATFILLPALFAPALSIPQHGFNSGGKSQNGKTPHQQSVDIRDVPIYFITDAGSLGVTASPTTAAPVVPTHTNAALASSSVLAVSSPVTTLAPPAATTPAAAPLPSSGAPAASDFAIKYPVDTLDLKVCVPAPNPVPSICLVSYHTNDKWVGQGTTGNYGVLLSFNSRCEPRGTANWYVTREDLKKGVDLDVGLATKGKLLAAFDPTEFTWSYGGKNYTVAKDLHYSGSISAPPTALYLSTVGSLTKSTYQMWQIPYDC